MHHAQYLCYPLRRAQFMHKPGPTEIHTPIDIDALLACIYPGTIYLAGRATAHSTDGSMTVYQLSPAEDAQKAAGELFAKGGVYERPTPGKVFQRLFPG